MSLTVICSHLPPLRLQRWLRDIFLMAQPPILSEEGNAPFGQFIHTFPVCAFSERDHFLNGANTPPSQGGECARHQQLRRI